MTGTSLLPFYSADATTKLARALLTHKSKHYFYTQSNLLQKTGQPHQKIKLIVNVCLQDTLSVLIFLSDHALNFRRNKP